MIYCLVIAVAIIIFLLVKLYLVKKSAREISEAFAEKIGNDTNTLIDISSRDADMIALAENINTQLKLLRKEQLQYYQGNIEVKNAITNISHDIRTPLTAIYGYLEMMQKTDDEEKKAKYINIMKDRAELMKQLTEELFRYSVVLSDDNKMETEDVFVNQVLAESISSFYPELSGRGIAPEITITQKRIIRKLNKEALQRVFSNIINNAVKYSDGDLKITLYENGDIEFSNTAKEISAVEVERLFDRFYTVEAAHHSTGLGLSIAKTLVGRMGGIIKAEYKADKLIIKISFDEKTT
jgi:hypothetical protein